MARRSKDKRTFTVSDKRSQWVLPAALERVRRKLRGSDDGDRQMVAILSAVLIDGLPAVEGACAEALAEGIVTGHPTMPEFRLEPDQIHDLLSFLKTLE